MFLGRDLAFEILGEIVCKNFRSLSFRFLFRDEAGLNRQRKVLFYSRFPQDLAEHLPEVLHQPRAGAQRQPNGEKGVELPPVGLSVDVSCHRKCLSTCEPARHTTHRVVV